MNLYTVLSNDGAVVYFGASAMAGAQARRDYEKNTGFKGSVTIEDRIMKTIENAVEVQFLGRLAGAVGDTHTITETVSVGSGDRMKLDLYEGRTASGNAYTDISRLEQLTRCYTVDDLDRINNDTNGNPRYVIHFLALLTDSERAGSASRYDVAVARARKMFGGRKYHNKSYGGGIVFQSYEPREELKLINAFHNGDQA